jgi:anthranilate synthase component 1
VALASRVHAALVVDHQSQTAWLMAEPTREDCLGALSEDLSRIGCRRQEEGGAEPLLNGGLAEEDPTVYKDAVGRAKAYIRDGDIFQANLSRRWHGRLQAGVEHGEIYRRLRASNPGPFAGIMRWGEHSVLSSSPERLLQVRGDMAQTRPIAGTRPRGFDRQSDRQLSSELIGHPKERAEHVMLIDLERNDLGRVCRPGTVEVNELMVIESYAHVHHIVSNVRGRLRPDVLPGDALRAVFPGGTITGCPKVRCMEIIDELEPNPRSAYTGSFGYLNRDGSLDTNILIRTLQIDGSEVSFRAGGGIVADSDAAAEVNETRAKARGLALALTGEA